MNLTTFRRSAIWAAPVALLAMATTLPVDAKVKKFKPSAFNLFSPDQDIQAGKEAAAEVEKTMQVVNNPELTNYVANIGKKLIATGLAGDFPYEFHVVNEPSINAFALPGGPMFVHTGLLAALDNETQLAGVMAHEISHVYLRHGTSNVSKANLIQLPAMLAGSIAASKGGIWGMLGQLGAGLGAQSLLLKYSRSAEKEADLNGAQMMNAAGYDPTEMARFFEKLNAEGGGQDNGKLANFLADHPTPGNRVKYVEDQNKELPKMQYVSNNSAELAHIKSIVAALPPPPKQPQATLGQGTAQAQVDPASIRPSGRMTQFQGRQFSVAHPDNWQAFGDQNGATVTIAPKAGMVQSQNGQVAIGMGMIAAYYFPQEGQKVNLQRDTAVLLQQMQQSDPTLKQNSQAKNMQVAGRNAILIPAESPSVFGGREFDAILTVDRPEGLFYMVFISPESEWNNMQQTFDQVVKSLKFTN